MAGYDIKYWCPLCGADGNVHGKDKDEAVEKLEKVEEEHEKRMGHRGFEQKNRLDQPRLGDQPRREDAGGPGLLLASRHVLYGVRLTEGLIPC